MAAPEDRRIVGSIEAGTCPFCHEALEGTVAAVVSLEMQTVAADTRAVHVTVAPTVEQVGMRLTHDCTPEAPIRPAPNPGRGAHQGHVIRDVDDKAPYRA